MVFIDLQPAVQYFFHIHETNHRHTLLRKGKKFLLSNYKNYCFVMTFTDARLCHSAGRNKDKATFATNKVPSLNWSSNQIWTTSNRLNSPWRLYYLTQTGKMKRGRQKYAKSVSDQMLLTDKMYRQGSWPSRMQTTYRVWPSGPFLLHSFRFCGLLWF